MDALKEQEKKYHICNPLVAEADLLFEINQMKNQNNNVKWEYKWAKSHQEVVYSGPGESDCKVLINDTSDIAAVYCIPNITQGLHIVHKNMFSTRGHIYAMDQ